MKNLDLIQSGRLLQQDVERMAVQRMILTIEQDGHQSGCRTLMLMPNQVGQMSIVLAVSASRVSASTRSRMMLELVTNGCVSMLHPASAHPLATR